MLKRGDTFLAGPDEEKLHLHVILTDPTAEGEVIVVAITTLRARSDRTVVLEAGDHPFIQHASVVAYSFAKIERLSSLEVDVKERRALLREAMSAGTVQRICDGLLESDFTENGVRHFFRALRES